MSKFSYSGSISRISILKDEVQNTFDDIDARLTGLGHQTESFSRAAVRRRHMVDVLVKYGVSERFGRSGIFPGTLDKGGVNWNVTNCRVTHTQNARFGKNGNDTLRPTIEIEAEYEAYNFLCGAYEIGILMYKSGAWTLVPGTDRPLGYMHADDQPLWLSPTRDYVNPAVTRWSETMASHETIKTVCSLADYGSISFLGSTQWALGIRVNNPASGYVTGGTQEVHSLDKAFLRIVARDNL